MGSQPVLCGQDVRILHKFLPKTNILFCKCDQINYPTFLTKQDCNWSWKDMLYGWKITPKKCWIYLPALFWVCSRQVTVRFCNPIAIVSSWKLFSSRKRGSSWYKAGKLGSSCQLRSIGIFSIFQDNFPMVRLLFRIPNCIKKQILSWTISGANFSF